MTLQGLAISLLCLQTIATGTAASLSARAPGREVGPLTLRPPPTPRLKGYLPVDASRDLVYQLVVGRSLAMVPWLLHQVARCRTRPP